jgi:hypothetical protein
MSERQQYDLRIDGALLRRQQRLLAKMIDTVNRGNSYAVATATDRGLLEGILDLLEAIDEQVSERQADRCSETQVPGPGEGAG